jgi:hypothetical protein
MILQEIISEIINQVSLKAKETLKTDVKGYGIAIKSPQGDILQAVPGNKGERFNIGIVDNRGTYFYIRLLTKVASRRLQRGEKLGACTENQNLASLRLVFIHQCIDPQKLLLVAQNALFSINLTNINWANGQNRVELFDKGYDFNEWDIYNAETDKPKTEFQSASIKLVSIDFELKFNTNYKFCNFQIC